MENPLKIPTDNLYKFKAVGFLTFLILSTIIFFGGFVYFTPIIMDLNNGLKNNVCNENTVSMFELISTMLIYSIIEILSAVFMWGSHKGAEKNFKLWQERLQDYQDLIIKKEAQKDNIK